MNKIILFVSQDQGSGNALVPVIEKMIKKNDIDIRVYAAKYSKKIFQNLDIDFTDLDETRFIDSIDFKPDLIVTGGSMRKSIEKSAIFYARQNNIKSLTLLDFWGNYWQRFTVEGQRDPKSLPDFILVPDRYAKEQMIGEGFPDVKLVVTGNPYFDTFSFLEEQKSDNSIKTVLFISQPLYRNGGYITDKTKIQDVIETLLETEQFVKLIIKPHPKESLLFYRTLREHDNIRIQLENNIKLLIKESDIVIGTDSTVLFEAVFSGRPVVSYQTEKGRKDHLVTNKLGLSYLVESREELSTTIQKIYNGELIAKSTPGIKYYNDGKCTERVVKRIEHLLARNRLSEVDNHQF